MKRKIFVNLEGTLIDGREHYSTRQVLSIFDIETERFRKWIEGDFITPNYRASGTGRTHYFTREQLYIIALFSKLVDIGLNRQVAKDIAHEITEEQWAEISHLKTPHHFIVRGDVTHKKSRKWKRRMKINMVQDLKSAIRDYEKETGVEVTTIISLHKITAYVDDKLS